MLSIPFTREEVLALSNLVSSKMVSPVTSVAIIPGPIVQGYNFTRQNNNIILRTDFRLCRHLLEPEVRVRAHEAYYQLVQKAMAKRKATRYKKPPAKGGGRGLLK